MRLVLVDTWATKWSLKSTRETFRWYIIKEDLVSKETNQYEDSNDDFGRAIVGDLLAENTDSVVIVMPVDFMQGWTVVYAEVLERLMAKFQDATVKISLRVKCLLNQRLLDILSVEGAKINNRSFFCLGNPNSATLDAMKNVRNPTMYVKLVADIEKRRLEIEDPKDVKAKPHEVFAPKKVLEEGSFSDVVIIASNGAQIQAHRCFLAVSSPVLMRMFKTKMKESETGRLEMTDVSEQGVQALLRYLYLGDSSGPEEQGIELAFELLRTAHMYEMRSLEAKMATCLIEKPNEDFSVEQAFKMYMFVRNIESAIGLKRKTIQILRTQLDQLESLPEYKELYQKPSNASTAMELFKDFAKPSST